VFQTLSFKETILPYFFFPVYAEPRNCGNVDSLYRMYLVPLIFIWVFSIYIQIQWKHPVIHVIVGLKKGKIEHTHVSLNENNIILSYSQ